jgi:hypothetical protein
LSIITYFGFSLIIDFSGGGGGGTLFDSLGGGGGTLFDSLGGGGGTLFDSLGDGGSTLFFPLKNLLKNPVFTLLTSGFTRLLVLIN